MNDRNGGDRVANRYLRTVTVSLVLIVAVWHYGYDTLVILRGWHLYEPHALVIAAWSVLTVLHVVGSVLLLRRGRLGRATAWGLSLVALAAGAAATVTYPDGLALSDASWAWGTVGWCCVLFLLDRPLPELLLLLAANTVPTVVALVVHGALDHVTTARLITITYATAGIQTMFAVVVRMLARAARDTTRAAARQTEALARTTIQDRVHSARQRRYGYLREEVAPLLRGLADGRLRPTDPSVSRRAALEAARLRRLFAEHDSTVHPLLHELRACSDVAERRGVQVTVQAYGDLPDIPVPVRRQLAEVALRVLTAAGSFARLTVLAGPCEVAVSVVADAPADALGQPGVTVPLTTVHDDERNWLWVETHCTVPREHSPSRWSTTIPWSSKGSRPG